jgi:hypothetical protein
MVTKEKSVVRIKDFRKYIPEIGSNCLGVLSLAFISANITDIIRMNKYGECGHPCLIPDCCWKTLMNLLHS